MVTQTRAELATRVLAEEPTPVPGELPTLVREGHVIPGQVEPLILAQEALPTKVLGGRCIVALAELQTPIREELPTLVLEVHVMMARADLATRVLAVGAIAQGFVSRKYFETEKRRGQRKNTDSFRALYRGCPACFKNFSVRT